MADSWAEDPPESLSVAATEIGRRFQKPGGKRNERKPPRQLAVTLAKLKAGEGREETKSPWFKKDSNFAVKCKDISGIMLVPRC